MSHLYAQEVRMPEEYKRGIVRVLRSRNDLTGSRRAHRGVVARLSSEAAL